VFIRLQGNADSFAESDFIRIFMHCFVITRPRMKSDNDSLAFKSQSMVTPVEMTGLVGKPKGGAI
jgi:hypothetical protein